jgi:hypothetical protein
LNQRLKIGLKFAAGTGAFLSSVYAVSNLMPMLLLAVTKGLNAQNGIWVAFYSLLTVVALGVLERFLYRMDMRTGRIRNKSELFE